VLDTLTTLGIVIAHELELLVNFRDGDAASYFVEMFDMVHNLSKNIALDISVISIEGK
jgi:hypothetical protein